MARFMNSSKWIPVDATQLVVGKKAYVHHVDGLLHKISITEELKLRYIWDTWYQDSCYFIKRKHLCK